MGYVYKQSHIPKSTPNNRRSGLVLTATTITIHNTANPSSTAQNERNWLTNPSNTATASYHIVIDQKEAIECIPLTEVGWHAGDGNGIKSGNRTSIGIELCESGDYNQVVENAVELVAKMLKERGWGIDKLRRHYDWSGKNCPRKMNNDGNWSGWFEFLDKVSKKLGVNPPLATNTIDKVTIEGIDIIKERVYASGGKLHFTSRASGIKATDVRRFSIDLDKYELKPVYAKNKKVSDLVKEHGAILGFNAPYHYAGNLIGMFHDGQKLHFSASDKPLKWHQISLVDGKYIIEKYNPSRTNQVWQGAPLLVENGAACWDFYNTNQQVQVGIIRNTDKTLARHQRTFVWLDSKNRLHVGIADGRVPNIDEGLTGEEMALYALSHGATWAINFDGGGSTILADKNGGINQSQNRGANERVNHHAILVVPKKKVEPEPTKPEEGTKLTNYEDVPAGAWYEQAVKTATDLGIMSGYPDGTFKPERQVTRAELAAVIAKLHSKGMI